MTVFCAILEQNKRIGEMWDFMAKVDKTTPVPGVIFKYTKKYYFSIQHLTKIFLNDNCVIFEKMMSQFSGRVVMQKLYISFSHLSTK